jgi:hypothetical protein
MLALFFNSVNRASVMTATFPFSVAALESSVIICCTVVNARNTSSVALIFAFYSALTDLRFDWCLRDTSQIHERFFIRNYHFYRTDRFLGRKGGTAIAVRKGIPHNHEDLPPIASIAPQGFTNRLVRAKYYL